LFCFFISIALPSAAKINEASIAALEKAKQLRCNNKYVSKYERATRPLAFCAGTGTSVLFTITHEYKTHFYKNIVTSS